MHKRCLAACLIVMLGALALPMTAQQSFGDVVSLKNGSAYEGIILHYKQGKTLIIQQFNGLEVEIPDEQILKIVQGVELKNAKGKEIASSKTPSKKRLQKQPGLYNITSISTATGAGSGGDLANGAGASTVFGYRFGPLLSVGLGPGVDNYNVDGQIIFPLFAECRGRLPSKREDGSLYASMAGGYGFAFRQSNSTYTDAKGGYFLYPALGYSFAVSERMEVSLDLGVKFQKAEFFRTFPGVGSDRIDLVFRRISFRLGLSFGK